MSGDSVRHELHGDVASLEPGVVYWLTGLSGAGKTTVARAVARRLREQGRSTVLLDGDVLREIFPRGVETGLEARRTLAGGYSRLCRELANQGLDVVCATISMFHDVRAWNRAHISRYVEVFLRVPREELQRRDPKGIYARLAAGTETNVMGFDAPAEWPLNPDLVLENHGETDAEQAAERVLALPRPVAPVNGPRV